MSRPPRLMDAGTIYHVLNRGNGRMSLFHKPGDFAAFEKVLGQALQRYPVDLLTKSKKGSLLIFLHPDNE